MGCEGAGAWVLSSSLGLPLLPCRLKLYSSYSTIMKCLIALLVCATALAEQLYVDKEYLMGLKARTDVDVFLSKTFRLELKNSWDLGMTVLLHVRGADADISLASKLPEVKYNERNGIASIDQCHSVTAAGCWGLDRTDQRAALDYTDSLNADAMYDYGEATGSGVNAYILDTGIDTTHSDFHGRAVFDYVADGLYDRDEDDDNGHGTHCAGIVGSRSYGLAKSVSLHAVQVLGDDGSAAWSSVIDGMVWVNNIGHQSGDKSVINMSFGGPGINSAVWDAVKSLYEAGIVISVSAGNSNADACSWSPAGTPEAITVAASNVNDVSAPFTNWGTCVDVFAPGVNVTSTVPGENTAAYSGSSMASPHVVGAISLYMSSLASAPTPADVAAWVTGTATPDALTWTDNDHGTSPNLLLYAPCGL